MKKRFLLGTMVFCVIWCFFSPPIAYPQTATPADAPAILIQVQDENGRWQFQRIGADGTHRNLLDDSLSGAYLRFMTTSRDGAWVYFYAMFREDNPPRSEPTSTDDLDFRVYRVSAEGGTPQQVIDDLVSGSYFCKEQNCNSSVRMTPDGQWFIYTPAYYNDPTAQGLYRVRVDGTDKIELTASLAGFTPERLNWVISQDGTWVYFNVKDATSPSYYSLYRVRTDGSAPPEFVTDGHNPNWRISGDWLLYFMEDGLNREPLAGGEWEVFWATDRPTEYPSGDILPVLPEPNIIVVRVARSDANTTRLVGVEITTGVELWNVVGDLQAVTAENWLLVKLGRFDEPTPLMRLRADGSEQSYVSTQSSPFIGMSVVNGEWLAFGTGRDQDSQIMAVNWVTGERHQLWQTDIPSTFLAYPESWSPDGQWVAFQVSVKQPDSRISSQIMIAPLDGSVPAITLMKDLYDFDAFCTWLPS